MRLKFKITPNNCYQGVLISHNKTKLIDITCAIRVNNVVYAVYKEIAYLADIVEDGDTIFISKGNEIEVAAEFIDRKIEEGCDVNFATPPCYFPRPTQFTKQYRIS